MADKDRKAYNEKVKCFINDKKVEVLIKKIAPEIYDKISENYKILEIAQYRNDPSVAGNYEIVFNGIPLYAGESGNVFIRACEHIYNMCYDENKFGFILPHDAIEIHFRITHLGITSDKTRKEIEAKAIQTYKHILQYTNPESPEYGKDKKKFDYDTKKWISRECIPIDWCVVPKLRKDRVEKLLSMKA